MEFSIPTSDLHADITDSETPSKHLTAARLAKAETMRKASRAAAQATQAAKLRERLDCRALASSDDDDDDDDEEQGQGSPPEHKGKPKRVPKPKLTAKEKEAAREEKAATKKQRTAERRSHKGEKVRRT